METPYLRRCFAELVGTFFLVLIGCGVIVVGGITEELTHEGIAIVWGLVVMVLIYAIGDVSGCHINPSVTLAFSSAGRFPMVEVPGYVAAQCLGAVLGAVALRCVFGIDESELGSTVISEPWSPMQGYAVESAMTALLMFVVMGVSTGAKEKSITAGLAVGATIAMEAMTAGPVTGASMNPARTLGPAVVAGNPGQVAGYAVATITGAMLGMLLYQLVGLKVSDRSSDR